MVYQDQRIRNGSNNGIIWEQINNNNILKDNHMTKERVQ